MAVDLHTGDTCLPHQDHHLLLHLQHNKGSDLRPELHRNDYKDDDLIAELTHHMDRFNLQNDDSFDFSGIASRNLELSWDLIGSPQSSVWSPLGSNQGSSEGSSQSQEASPPPTLGIGMGRMFEKRGNPSFNTSYQSLIQEQIRATESESEGRSEAKEERNGKGGDNGRKTRPQRPAPLHTQQQAASAGIRALFLGGSASTGGTGVFFPRAGANAPTQSTKKQGKGCSTTVLIPARVVQALQLHFDQMAATSGPKAGAFPPLHDVLVSNRDGMFSLQKPKSRKAPAKVKNEMILPQEWTY